MRWRDGIENPRGPVQKTRGRPGLQPERRRRLARPILGRRWSGGDADRLRTREILRFPQDDSGTRTGSLKARRPQLEAEGGLEEDLAIGGGGAAGCAGQAGSGAGAAGLGSATKTESAVG